MSPVKVFSSRLALRRSALGLAAILALVSGRAMAQRPLGIDVSHYQGTINWSSVKAAGIEFAWAKATEGSATGDTYFTANETGAKVAGVPIGAYHFAHPELHAPDVEAAQFWNTAKNYIQSGGDYVQPMVGMEAFSGLGGARSLSDWGHPMGNIHVSHPGVPR